MITVTFYDDTDKRQWEYRLMKNGVVECRNERHKLDWQERTPEQMDMLADELYVIGQSLNQIASMHVAGQKIARDSNVLVPQTQDMNVPV